MMSKVKTLLCLLSLDIIFYCSLLDLDIIVVAVVRSWRHCCCIVSFICLASLALDGLIFLVLLTLFYFLYVTYFYLLLLSSNVNFL